MDEQNTPENEAPIGKEKLGVYFKRARQSLNLEIQDVSRETKIAGDFLKNLEASEYQALPGDAYTRAYLKTLAKRYGLDPDKVIQWYFEETKPHTKLPEHELAPHYHHNDNSVDTPTYSESTPAPAISKKTLLGILAGVLFLFIIFKLSTKPSNTSIPKDSVLDTTASDTVTITPEPFDNGLMGIDTNGKDDTIPPGLLNNQSPSNAASSNASGSSSASTSESKKDSTKTASNPGNMSVMQVTCTNDTWIQVLRRGRESWARMVHKGAPARVVTHNDTMTVKIGNPSKIQIQLNGQTIKVDRPEFKVFSGKVIF